ncbi:MAG: CotH kinase family protein [Treponema sp.]|nr:CotH kinase family protein [Treponema sp.]
MKSNVKIIFLLSLWSISILGCEKIVPDQNATIPDPIVKEVKKYICPVDGKEYDSIEKAMNCCKPETEEIEYYVCPVCGKQYSIKKDAADCCKTPIEDIPTIYINKEILVSAPTYRSDDCNLDPDGKPVTITSYFYEDSSVEGGLRYTKDHDEAEGWRVGGLKERGQFTVTSTSNGLKISTNVDDKYKNGSICIANLSLGWVQNVALTNAANVTKKGNDYIYPFVKPGDRYKVWFYFADENWANGWDGYNGSIEIIAIGGIGNYAVTNNGYNFDNNSCSMYLKDFSVICPKDLLDTAILDKKQLSGNMYSNKSYNNGVGWTNQIYITNNCIDFSAIKNKILNVEDFFADVSYSFEYDGNKYECKIIGEYQYFTYTTEPQPFAVSVKGGTMEQQYSYLKPSIEKLVNNLKETTSYELPIIYVTTFDTEEVLQKEYYDCYVEMFNCDGFEFSGKKAGIKVRGNSTSEGSSKPYRIKFDKKQNMLGLHEGKKYKSWVLLNTNGGMDYVGFNLARKIYESSTDFKYYASDCTFVHVYINNEYKGMRLLCEQSQTGKDRVDITELAENDSTTKKTGYFLELDNYAWRNRMEEPVFSLNYPQKIEYMYQNDSWRKDKSVSVNGYNLVFESQGDEKVYRFKDILGHDISYGGKNYLPEDLYTIKSDTYSKNQIEYIGKWMNNVWEICYQAIVHKTLYRMDADHDLVTFAGDYSDEAAKSIISDYIDLESLMNEFILEELVRDNDVGAGSFYMAVDFTKTINEKYGRLTFECPWDFNWAYIKYDGDSTFFGAGPKYYAGAYQPMYVIENNEYDRSNFWFTLFNKAPWFRKMIKERWDKLPKEEIKALCDTLKTKAGTAESEGNFEVSGPVNFVKERVDEIDQTLWGN